MGKSVEPKPVEDMALLKAGDDRAFERLVRHHHRALMAVARAIVGDSEAEEVVQIAWIKAYKALPAFEGRAALRTWLTRIVVNEARMQRRSRRKECFIDDVFPADGNPLDDRFSPGGRWQEPPVAWQADSPDALLMGQQLGDCIERLMHDLPEGQRTLLELRDMSGLDFDEICNMLDVSASNARVLLHRARGRLFKLVDHYQETGEC